MNDHVFVKTKYAILQSYYPLVQRGFLERRSQDFQKHFEELPNFDVIFVDLIFQG